MKCRLTILLIYFTLLISFQARGQYLSPTKIISYNSELYIALSTREAIVELALNNSETRDIELGFNPSSFKIYDGVLYVTNAELQGRLYAINIKSGKTLWKVDVGAYPSDMVISKNYAYIANRFENSISVVALSSHKVIKKLLCNREPISMAISPDSSYIAVTNYLPAMSSLDNLVAASVTIIDVTKQEVVKHITLENGTHSTYGVCFSKDGRWIYTTNILSRFMLPTTQVERGWMNTNALSVIDVDNLSLYNTVLLDNTSYGSANPAEVTVSGDGSELYVAISGCHEIAVIDLKEMMNLLAMSCKDDFLDIPYNISFLSDIKTRIPTAGRSPRHLLEKGGKIYVSCYFDSSIDVIDADGKTLVERIKIGCEPEMSSVRRGEAYFCDAAFCFQSWQSCISCHPGVRSDGLNWDLMNDGLGNPKNTKSLVLSHVTPPSMITGIRASAEIAVRAGISHIQFAERPEADAEDIDSYLKSLSPLKSPYLVKGKLSSRAKVGARLFIEAQCSSCHLGQYYTDCRKWDVGTGVDSETNIEFDTPSLREVWRTSPYLYNGAAKDIKEVLTKLNPDDRHGNTSKLSQYELDCLSEYVLSL